MKIQIRTKDLIIFESSLFRTTTSLILGEDYILLIDPNLLPVELDFIEYNIEKISKNKEKYLLFTHSDYDHIIGYGQFKNYKTIASVNFINNKEKASIIKQINTFDDEYYIGRNYNIDYPEINIAVDKNIQDMKLGSDEYIFYQAQGHNKDGIITYNKSKGLLITGDYLSNIEFPFIYFSFNLYKKTLNTFETILNEQNVKLMIPGHGDFTDDKREMFKRISESKKYIDAIEKSIVNEIKFDKEKLFSQYKFPISLNKYHEDNIKLLKKELGKE